MYPDPVLTANLYCARHLDEALHRVIGPFWRAIRQHEPGAGASLWTLRSGARGEHLKVRLHGPESLADPARAALQRAAAAFFARLDGRLGEPPAEWRDEGAVDADDETGSDHPDRSLLWTRYRRSPVWLGGGPFLDDDGYVSRITRCLAAACERVLLLETDTAGRIPYRLRQSTLLEGLVAGLAVPGLAADARPAYLAYHRDTLLRSCAGAEKGRVENLLQHFDRRVEAFAPAASALRQAALSAWTPDAAEAEPRRVDAAWCGALANLLWYIRPLCDDPDYHIDPLAEDPAFVPVFKAFHGFANQLGLKPVEEAFAYHFLWSVICSEESQAALAGAGLAAKPAQR